MKECRRQSDWILGGHNEVPGRDIGRTSPTSVATHGTPLAIASASTFGKPSEIQLKQSVSKPLYASCTLDSRSIQRIAVSIRNCRARFCSSDARGSTLVPIQIRRASGSDCRNSAIARNNVTWSLIGSRRATQPTTGLSPDTCHSPRIRRRADASNENSCASIPLSTTTKLGIRLSPPRQRAPD